MNDVLYMHTKLRWNIAFNIWFDMKNIYMF